MGNNFILIDKNNNIEKNAQMIVKFNFEGNNYLVYSIEENEQNSQIFVSKLIMNSEGKFFIDDISVDEKNKLSNIVYNIVIVLPSDMDKGNDFQVLINNLFSKFTVKLLNGLPELNSQDYFSNCSIAITSKILVNNALQLYGEKLKLETKEVSIPTWTAPVEVIAPTPVDNLHNNEVINSTIAIGDSVNVIEDEKKVVENPIINENIDSPQLDISLNVQSTNSILNEEIKNTDNSNLVVSNPQIEKLAIVSDPSLGIGVQQPNVMQSKKAGFANTKYVVIGTVCLVLAVAVVITAYILISNLK